MANIPVNKGAQLLVSGASITGSFSGFIVCPSSSTAPETHVANFTGLKDGNGASLLSGSNLFVLAGGAGIPMSVTSASLGANSANVLFYQ
jgi:hypothetical protein